MGFGKTREKRDLRFSDDIDSSDSGHPRHLYRVGSLSSQKTFKEDDVQTRTPISRSTSRGFPTSEAAAAEADADQSGYMRGGGSERELPQLRGSAPGVLRKVDSVGTTTGLSLHSKTPSGRSIKSRTASRAEYHDDLKPSLRHGLTRNLFFTSLIILMSTSFLFGYNIGVLNQPAELTLQDCYAVVGVFCLSLVDFWHSVQLLRIIGRLQRRTADENLALSQRNPSLSDSLTVEKSTVTLLWSLTTTLIFPGGMIGAYGAGYIADRFGRKGAVLLSLIPAVIGSTLSTACVAAGAPELLMIGRFITGINCGMASQLGAMYLLEIAPFNLRGAFGTASQLFCTIGIFIGSVLGLREILGTESRWPFLLLVNCGPAVLGAAVLPFLPDSPRYLMIVKKRHVKAEKALRFLRGCDDVSADMEEMATECQMDDVAVGTGTEGNVKKKEEEDEEVYTMMRLLTTKELRTPLLVTVVLQITQQLSGINAIFVYSTRIFKEGGVEPDAIQYAVLVTNAVNVIMTVVAVPIMDRAGRRPLLLFPMIVMILINAVITIAFNLRSQYPAMSYVSIGCILAYVICFAVGLGPIPMMITAEIFRQGPRPRAMSLAGLTNWLFSAILSMTFEPIKDLAGDFTFLIFLILLLFFAAFTFFKVPETKNKTIEEIASQFQPGGDIEVEEYVDDDVMADDYDDTSLHDLTAAGAGPGTSLASGSMTRSAGNVMTVTFADEPHQTRNNAIVRENSV